MTITSQSELTRVHDLYTQTKYKNSIRAKSRKLEGSLNGASCAVCGAVNDLEIHHDSYEDSATDYRILCITCHAGFHRFAKAPIVKSIGSRLAALDNIVPSRLEAEKVEIKNNRIARKLLESKRKNYRMWVKNANFKMNVNGYLSGDERSTIRKALLAIAVKTRGMDDRALLASFGKFGLRAA